MFKSPRMWCDFMDSMFQSPLMLLKSGSMPSIGDDFDEEKAPTFETTKADLETWEVAVLILLMNLTALVCVSLTP